MKKLTYLMGSILLLIGMLATPTLAGEIFKSPMFCRFALEPQRGEVSVNNKGDVAFQMKGLQIDHEYRCFGSCTLTTLGQSSHEFEESCRTNENGALRIKFKGVWKGISDCEWPAFTVEEAVGSEQCFNGFEHLPLRTFGQ